MKKHPSPLQAIRNRCLNQCCKSAPAEVRVCDAEGQCPVWPLRFGNKPDDFTGNVLKTIHAQCKMCLCSDQEGGLKVKDCPNKNCALWRFRMAKNPNRKGVGGGNAEALKKWRNQTKPKPLTEHRTGDLAPNNTKEFILARESGEKEVKPALNAVSEARQKEGLK